MLQWLIEGIKKAIHLHWWIAFCALSLVWKNQMELGLPIRLGIAEGFIFFGTLAIYSLHRWRGAVTKAVGTRFLITQKNTNYLLLQSIISTILSSICFLLLRTETQILASLPIFIAIGYVLPIFGWRLRDWLSLKIIWVAGVWAWLSLLLSVDDGAFLYGSLVWRMFLEQFCWLVALTLGFDLRDRATDKADNVRTIPVLIGEKYTIVLANILLLGAIVLSFYRFSVLNPFFFANMLTYLCSAWAIWCSQKRTNDLYFYGLLDGMICLGALLNGFVILL